MNPNPETLFWGVFVAVVVVIVGTWIYRYIEYRKDLKKAHYLMPKRRLFRDMATEKLPRGERRT